MAKPFTKELSALQEARLAYAPGMPEILRHISTLDFAAGAVPQVEAGARPLFTRLANAPVLRVVRGQPEKRPLAVGVVLSGGQAPGGHNVIAAIFDAIKEVHPESRLVGFCNGPAGIVKNDARTLEQEELARFRNQGGFDLIGSGRTKIETETQFQQALNSVTSHRLDGLVVIGGDDSNTNAAYLAEFFSQQGSPCVVAGVPKTIDGDLQNSWIELPFGFDTACKTYAETIGNICRDAVSAKKYYYFIKLMGRSASHITLECALKTRPNLALIGEEVRAEGKTLQDIARLVAELVVARAQENKEYGVILVPEGLIEFTRDIGELIGELNRLLAREAATEAVEAVVAGLNEGARRTFAMLPQEIQRQLLSDRDPHGNVQVSKIETERLLIHLVNMVLEAMRREGAWQGKFSAQPIFCGYEGRAALPSNFDASYGYSLGRVAALLVMRRKTGYIACIKNLCQAPAEWEPQAAPLAAMLHLEERGGTSKAVIQKAFVDLSGAPFQCFAKARTSWRLDDCYMQPGPIQFFGPSAITDSVPLVLSKSR